MMRLALPAAAALMLSVASPVAANCLDEIEQLEARLDQLPEEEEEQPTEQVEVETQQGDVTVTAPEGGADPQERWFHLPRSVEGARERLDGAREVAEDGDEEGCQELVEEARDLVSGLEEEAGGAAAQ